jgi:hypothetical protein
MACQSVSEVRASALRGCALSFAEGLLDRIEVRRIGGGETGTRCPLIRALRGLFTLMTARSSKVTTFPFERVGANFVSIYISETDRVIGPCVPGTKRIPSWLSSLVAEESLSALKVLWQPNRARTGAGGPILGMAQANPDPPFFTLMDHLDAGFVQSPEQGLERRPVGLERTRLLFHALDGGQRHARGRGEISLVPAQQTSGGAQVLTGEFF